MLRLLILVVLTGFASVTRAQQIDLERIFEERNLGPVTELLEKGDYELVARIGQAAADKGLKAPEWRLLRMRALAELGQQAVALEESKTALALYPGHLELLMLRHDLALQLGNAQIATETLASVNAAARTKPAKERSAQDWVMLGRAALTLKADAQKVITQYFKVAQSRDPKLEDAYLAEGHLALAKSDAKRAAEVFRAGLKAHGETARLRHGLARAFLDSDREKAVENLAKALTLNPHSSEALLLRAELFIGAEKFLEAEAAVQQVLDVDEQHPKAWALRAVVAHLFLADEQRMHQARAEALRRWPSNPEVDHVIGRCLSRAYRFAESAAHQKQALQYDPLYLPAKIQLCHDLLRLGDEEEAWKLAAAVRQEDGYNIQAHNLGLLEKEMGAYVTQAYPDFVLKMPKRDWLIYGERALALLREAKATLTAKYGLQMDRPVLVEFFGSQPDFAIRTFGALGGQGMLGVCFGTVVTMNSPGSLAQGRSNWESTLWHEYCHVVTLSVTKNRMPRWLSEGISVYEERQRDAAWGMRMDAKHREMVLDDETLTPLSQLSGAFMNPKSQEHLMFAYYESSQAVEYLLERYGPTRLNAVLGDLAGGRRVNDAIAANTEKIEAVEAGFRQFIIAKAEAFGSRAEWQQPRPEELNPADETSLSDFMRKRPASLWGLRKRAAAAVERKQWAEVLEVAEKLIELVPEDYEGEGGYALKALALRHLNREEDEAQVLRLIGAHSGDAQSTFLRLLELDLPRQRWAEVKVNAQRAMAINPFLTVPQKAFAEACAALNETAEAAAAWERVLMLDPSSAAQTHYKLAVLLKQSDAPRAKRHLLDSLALAPRNREGLALLRSWP